MLHVTLASLRAHLRRLLSTGTAIVLGVGFLAATLFIGDSMRSSFDDLYRQANDGLAVEVRSSLSFGSDDVAVQSGTVDLALVPAVEALDGVRRVAPTYEGRGQILDADGDPMGGGGPPTLAGNWIDDPDLNPYRIAEGRAPAASGEVVIDRRSADDGGLAVGDRTTVLTPAPVDVEIVGVATFGDSDSLGPVSWVAFTDEQAAELFLADDGQASSLRIAADEATDAAALAAAVDEIVPGDLDVRTGEQVAADELAALEGDFIGFFETMLLAFAAIALLVATFSIHNTFAILVAQRVRESALLRAIGATRRQVTTAVAVEALVIGATASAVGVVAGIGLARLAFAAMEAAGFGTGASVAVEPSAVIWSMAVGVVVAVVAAVAPAVGASRVPPIAALRDVAVERTSVSRARVAGGVVLLVASVLALVAAPSFDAAAVKVAGLGALGLLVSSVVFGPVAAGPVASVLGAPVEALRGLTGRLSRRNAVRNPRRTSGTASALTIGVAVVVLFTVLAASISSMLDDVVDRDFGGDLVVSTTDFSGAGLSGDLAAAIDERPEVARAVGIGNGVLQVDGETWFAAVVDAPRLEGLLALDVVDGDMSAVGDGTIALATEVADAEGLTVGDTIDATLAGGSEKLEVAAVYETSPLLGDVLLPPAVWSRHTAQSSDVAVLIEGSDGVAPSDLDAAVTEVTEAHSAPAPQTREEYVEAAAGQIDQVLGIVYGLLAIAVLIAVMGIANTISLSVHERTREIGLLRAVGLSRSQLRSMVRWESVVVASYGTVIGLAMGLAAVWGLLRAMSELEDVATPMQVPVTSLAVVVLVGIVAGVVAAWRPARRAARMDVLAAVATD